ncbi:Immunoglobulin G-binding protein A [Colletotrichum fructicola]|nr:Immunoglobulin G-binding protein A [Colletotrichum fructicola]
MASLVVRNVQFVRFSGKETLFLKPLAFGNHCEWVQFRIERYGDKGQFYLCHAQSLPCCKYQEEGTDISVIKSSILRIYDDSYGKGRYLDIQQCRLPSLNKTTRCLEKRDAEAELSKGTQKKRCRELSDEGRGTRTRSRAKSPAQESEREHRRVHYDLRGNSESQIRPEDISEDSSSENGRGKEQPCDHMRCGDADRFLASDEPGEDPGDESSDEPGDEPGEDDGDEPGDDPGEDPGDDDGDEPGDDPGEDPGDDDGDEPGDDDGDEPGDDDGPDSDDEYPIPRRVELCKTLAVQGKLVTELQKASVTNTPFLVNTGFALSCGVELDDWYQFQRDLPTIGTGKLG